MHLHHILASPSHPTSSTLIHCITLFIYHQSTLPSSLFIVTPPIATHATSNYQALVIHPIGFLSTFPLNHSIVASPSFFTLRSILAFFSSPHSPFTIYFPHFSQLYSQLSTPDWISSYFRLIVSFTQSRLSQLLYFSSQHQPPSLLMQYYDYFTSHILNFFNALLVTISFSNLHLISIIS